MDVSVVEVFAIDERRAMVVLADGEIIRGGVAFPVAVIKSMVVSVTVRPGVTVVVRVPSDVIIAIHPGYRGGFVPYGIERQPDPTVHTVVAPNAVVVGMPTPGIIRDPVPTRVLYPAPVAVLIGFPVFFVRVRHPEAIAVDVDPATQTR